MNDNDNYTIVSVNTSPHQVGFRHCKTGYITTLPCTEEQSAQCIGLLRKRVRCTFTLNITEADEIGWERQTK